MDRQEIRMRILNWSFCYADGRRRGRESNVMIVMRALQRGAVPTQSNANAYSVRLDREDAAFIDAQLLRLRNDLRLLIVEEYRRPSEYLNENRYFASVRAKARKFDLFPKDYLKRLDDAEMVFARQIESVENKHLLRSP